MRGRSLAFVHSLCILQFVALESGQWAGGMGGGMGFIVCVVFPFVAAAAAAGGAVRGSWRFMTLQNAIKFN